MTVPPKRRWFRFSLRTLFVLVTIVACWLGWQLKWIRDRREFLKTEGFVFATHKLPYSLGTSTVTPWRYRILGEDAYLSVSLYVAGADREHLTTEDRLKLAATQRLFPESAIRLVHGNKDSLWTGQVSVEH